MKMELNEIKELDKRARNVKAGNTFNVTEMRDLLFGKETDYALAEKMLNKMSAKDTFFIARRLLEYKDFTHNSYKLIYVADNKIVGFAKSPIEANIIKEEEEFFDDCCSLVELRVEKSNIDDIGLSLDYKQDCYTDEIIEKDTPEYHTRKCLIHLWKLWKKEDETHKRGLLR